MAYAFLIHGDRDHVGVAIRDLKAGERVTGIYLSSQQVVPLTLSEDIPLGHKVALTDLGRGDHLLKYNEVIGTVIEPIRVGMHVHIHNLQSVRWAE